MSKVVFDYDWVVFKAACAVENRFVRVLNKKSNEELIFKNRTEVYGDWRKKNGGWLSEQSSLTLNDLEITDDREVEDVSHTIQIAKTIINGTLENLGSDDYYGYVSGEGNFRKDICTLLPYKGQRENMISPLYRKEVADYVIKHHGAIPTVNREPDDAVVTDMHTALTNKEYLIGAISEKDYMGCSGNWWHYDLGKLVKVRGFGHLERNSKGAVKGQGRIWKYFQVCFSDTSDNYAANCFSDKKNGEVAVYNRLKDCKDDKEAFLAMKEHFQYLYPEPKVITNWKGDTFEIDWLYVMQEMFNLAHLQRWEDDRIDLKVVFKGLGIEV